MKAASWALEHGINVVICNGSAQHTIKAIMDGRKVGTFFTNVQQPANPPELQAAKGESSICYVRYRSSVLSFHAVTILSVRQVYTGYRYTKEAGGWKNPS